MSKRAEEAAMKAYPPHINKHSIEKDFDWNEEYRDVFQEGYERAEKDTIERVIEWLESHSNDYIFKDDYMGKEELKISAKMFGDLKKAMEE